MIDKEKVMVGLPAYNEANVIGKVVWNVQKKGFKNIVVVDDRSNDGTGHEAEKFGAKVLYHKKNKGAGGATKTLLSYAKKQGYDYLVLMDSDGQHSSKDIDKLLKYAHEYDVVIGSRMMGHDFEQMPFTRKLANFIASFVTFVFFWKFVRDSQSGFKVLNKRAIKNIKITFDRYEFCSEIIGEIKRHNLSVKEVPIKVIYNSHSKEKEHGQTLFNSISMCFRFSFYFLKRIFGRV